MRKCCTILILCLLVAGCTKDPNVLVPHVSGYWEIQEVTLASGEKKVYQFNQTIDYIIIDSSLNGFRKKLKPGFNNTYTTSKDVETIEARIENDSLNLYYKTLYATWKETVLNADEGNLTIINQNKDVYLYKRYQSLTLDIEE